MALTAEQRAKGRATQAAKRAAAVLPVQRQCVYCGNRFDEDMLAEHQRLAHKGEVPVAEASHPVSLVGAVPGTIVRDGKAAPRKVRWTREYMEKLADEGKPGFEWTLYDPPQTTPWQRDNAKYLLIAGQDNRVPACVAHDVRESFRKTREAVAPRGLVMRYNGMGIPEGVVGVLEGAGFIREGA